MSALILKSTGVFIGIIILNLYSKSSYLVTLGFLRQNIPQAENHRTFQDADNNNPSESRALRGRMESLML